ncbi:MAG: DUF3107 domain-containing protein [Actinomycetia bacterium]|nr:DUF3107 domain-containing protein [Actinomycetes bacterium]MCH9800949.1 DUF3107 domain-containing protein [Actinomycetes bacterium]
MTTRKRTTSRSSAKASTGERVEVRIGVQHAARELVLESGDPAGVEKAVQDGLTAGGLVEITDVHGAKLLIPGDKLAYVELGAPSKPRVGFGAG